LNILILIINNTTFLAIKSIQQVSAYKIFLYFITHNTKFPLLIPYTVYSRI